MSATAPLAPSSSQGGITFPSTDPHQNPNPDPFNNGPSVYVYGFLAALLLIFLVSMGVAWKGYYTRRLLRARIDEAIARGVLIPGYDPSNPNLPLFPPTTLGSRRRNAQVITRPVLHEEWIAEKGDVEDGEGKWDIKPTALDVLRPYDRTPLTPPHHPSSHANSLLNQLLDPLRQYWFVQPPEGADADQLQGRPATTGARARERRRGESSRDRLGRLEEEQMEKKKMEESMGLSGVHEVVASVLIAMPDRGHPTWGFRSAGIAGASDHSHAGYAGYAGAEGGVASGNRPSSWQQQQRQTGVASGSRPTSLSTPAAHDHTTSNHGHGTSNSIGTAVLEPERKEELPALVLGVVLLGLREEMNREAVEEGEGAKGVSEARVVPAGDGASGKGKEPAVTTPL